MGPNEDEYSSMSSDDLCELATYDDDQAAIDELNNRGGQPDEEWPLDE